MTVKQYLIILGLCTALCWLGWILVITLLNPFTSGSLALLLFYLSLGLALIGGFSILGFVIRVFVFTRNEVPSREISISSRQALLFTILIIVSLILQSFRLLTWWSICFMALLAGFTELFFLSYKKFNR
ncbi:MAG TPA: hypothetical protein VKP03_02860 [Patescibacteria group bacterium]|nr:hypothetical protein [Patescibacteria group bacterium]